MHEMSLMADLFKKLDRLAAAQGGGRITKVRVKLGALAHISPDHFREHFDQASPGTPVASASLEVWQDDDTKADDAGDIVLESIDVEDGA
jgi:hydrogenase nickel incorporation protein HypA/HybF